jgi:hypothetical protein
MKTKPQITGFTVATYKDIPVIPDMGTTVNTISKLTLIDVSLINGAFQGAMPYWRDDGEFEDERIIKITDRKITCKLDGCSHRRGKFGCTKQNKILRDKYKYLEHGDVDDINIFMYCRLKEEVTSKW